MCLWLLPSFPQASGDRSKLILIWEAQSCQHLYTFTGHRDAVSVRLWVFSGCLLRGPTWCWAPAYLLGTSPLGSECCGRVLSVLKTLGEMEIRSSWYRSQEGLRGSSYLSTGVFLTPHRASCVTFSALWEEASCVT